MKTLVCAVLSLSFLTGCITVSSISTSPIPTSAVRQNRIASSASNLVLFAIPFGNSFVERAREKLVQQCPQGKIEGILSKHQHVNYFLGFATLQELSLEGYCLSPLKKG